MIKEGFTRVSEILAQWDRFGHIDPFVLENKQRIGTNVHAMISSKKEGFWFELEEDEQGYYESWQKWVDKIKPTILEAEKRYHNEAFQLTGAVDAIIKVEEKEIIVDYKTSASPAKKSWALQGGFYHFLAVQERLTLSDEYWFVRLKKDGSCAITTKFTITSDVLEVCFAALRTYRYFNG